MKKPKSHKAAIKKIATKIKSSALQLKKMREQLKL